MKLGRIALLMMICVFVLAITDVALGIKIEPKWKDFARFFIDGVVAVFLWETVKR
ncbi:MAG: hypothetical protein Q8P76_03015 [bacterium]|nr:hypothetical protein [bacterium]